MRQALCGQEVLPDDWMTTANVIRDKGKTVLGVSSGRKTDMETWWWNKEVREYLQRKRLAKKKWGTERTEESRQESREMQSKVTVKVAKVKQSE